VAQARFLATSRRCPAARGAGAKQERLLPRRRSWEATMGTRQVLTGHLHFDSSNHQFLSRLADPMVYLIGALISFVIVIDGYVLLRTM
jgi:hypothetical protein